MFLYHYFIICSLARTVFYHCAHVYVRRFQLSLRQILPGKGYIIMQCCPSQLCLSNSECLGQDYHWVLNLSIIVLTVVELHNFSVPNSTVTRFLRKGKLSFITCKILSLLKNSVRMLRTKLDSIRAKLFW